MADDCDFAKEVEEQTLARNIALVLKNGEIKPGQSGDCELCGEWSGHLILAACARCRDRYKLP